MKSGRQNIKRIRFAKQLIQMGNFEKCKKIIRDIIDEAEPTGLEQLFFNFIFSLLL